ncbi:coiled-coil domain-containing protein 189 [Scyliorhinus canicula]|uniref:coiled-coil domain-containing protein 189 n=1 Tax=Scyliorhinus canicula TaxID=7830 RepID=UPI0018F4932D|nr:coiled-coil domain-containing protein 189 [Scyliorhinus canicula]
MSRTIAHRSSSTSTSTPYSSPRTRAFNKEQTSALFLHCPKRLHQACTATSLGNVDECFHYFLELVLCHSVGGHPSALTSSTVTGQSVTDYILDTYFRHFKLYSTSSPGRSVGPDYFLSWNSRSSARCRGRGTGDRTRGGPS